MTKMVINETTRPIVRKPKPVEHGSGEEATQVRVFLRAGVGYVKLTLKFRPHAGMHRDWKLRRSSIRHRV